MAYLIIVRHGQSQWNLENRFTGWKDVDITEKGKEEAQLAGKLLKAEVFEEAFTSTLKRAQHTLSIILDESDRKDISIIISSALNERSYGQLEGLNKSQTALKYGEQQVHLWRRSYDVAPPGGESLKETADRVIVYFKEEIAPLLQKGKNILVVAHGNSLRALKMYLEKLSPEQISEIEIPTGIPLKYELDANLGVISVDYITS
ncbi:2,3-bisphosphoglycerate-dependent phosphoglycerate mutase [Olivibacter domesticus]|uniref:2,3-bisphosphoglycerate-dependent phosphoglycerate mutase n=1 Tax=Olivibacter domesticus TaxID=407022 RepID=A0A1H7WAY5_OLID1|nr:2,3-diphosphoglycerate-dependent phosphoglycerate mutase [Olivibacter domesticus]SEM18239.1 2,3-bisphosphoglycerate-dependent phosphoglycerate mutase [Olivibacter domesticus]